MAVPAKIWRQLAGGATFNPRFSRFQLIGGGRYNHAFRLAHSIGSTSCTENAATGHPDAWPMKLPIRRVAIPSMSRLRGA